MASTTQTISPASAAFARTGAAIERASAAFGGILPPMLITAVAGFLRFWRLSEPHEIIPLDETYYAPNSFGWLCHGADMSFVDKAPHTCEGLSPTFAVHPPVAKLLIAVGIKIFGYRPFGWRFSAALAGTLSVLIIYLIGRRLWPAKRWPAAAAAILVGACGLQFVQSRLAMLDIFVSFFILLGIWLLLEDRARAPNTSGIRWWRLASGVAFGLAIGSKWGAIPMLPVVAAVALAWEAVRIRDLRDRRMEEEMAARAGEEPVEPPPVPVFTPAPRPPGRRNSFVFQILAVLVTFFVVPAIVYLTSYTPWFLSTKRYVPPRCNDTVVVEGEPKSVPYAGFRLWWCNQREILDYHRNLKSVDAEGKPIHPYMSEAWSWPWISRPASHYFESYCTPGRTPVADCPTGAVRDEEILGLPNPLIWWAGFFIALPVCLFWMVARRDEVAALLVVLFAPLVITWLPAGRPLFMFYMTPASPFLALMVVHLLHRWRLRLTAVSFVALCVALFGYFYPVLAAYPLPPHGAFGWESRIWFGHGLRGDCVPKPASDKIKLLCWI